MILVAGLGNPGSRYAWTRHNAGWHVIDLLRERLSAPRWSSTRESEIWGPCKVDDHKVFLLKPMTYMNLSGVAVKRSVRSLGIDLEDIIVVYDDIALPFGRIRFRPGGSAGGHRGMISVIGHMGSAEIARIRIGIGGSDPDRELIDYVTDPFTREELSLLPSICDRASDSVLLWISRGPEETMRVTNAPPDHPRENRSGDRD